MTRDEKLNEIADHIQRWLDLQWNDMDGCPLKGSTYIMRVPEWPTRGQLKEWIKVLRPPDVEESAAESLFIPGDMVHSVPLPKYGVFRKVNGVVKRRQLEGARDVLVVFNFYDATRIDDCLGEWVDIRSIARGWVWDGHQWPLKVPHG